VITTTDYEVMPTAAEVEQFERDGFLVVDRITTDEEIDALVPIFEAAFDGVEGSTHKKAQYQTMMPELRFPELLDTIYLRNARRYAAALLRIPIESVTSWGHMIRKPTEGSRIAPWHQDEAYWEPELRYRALGSWLPLHDCPVEQGAMQFIPGSHRWGVLDHDFHDGDRVHNLLEARDVDVSSAVACPLTKGGCTFHHQRTLHFTQENTTDRPRLAYPIEHQLEPVVRDEPRRWWWVDAHRAARGKGALDVYVADGRVVKNGL
jgi:hypothetical protein